MDRRQVILIILVFLIWGSSLGQDRVTVFRLTQPVTFDGIPDEPAWTDCPTCPMVMNSPNFGDSPTERTEMLLGYDDDYFYAAGRLFVSKPEYIRSISKKGDRYWRDRGI